MTASLPPNTACDAGAEKGVRPKGGSRKYVVVIDPGHGGRDPGAVSGDGLVKEKDVVLEIASRVKKEMESDKDPVKIVLTRKEDESLSLKDRTEIANSADADVFISIHCNSTTDNISKGTEIYFLSPACSQRAMRVAARENGIPLSSMSDVEATLLDLMVTSKKSESEKLAQTVHDNFVRTLGNGSGRREHRGIRSAPFYVLIGANMPSILIEAAFLSNPNETRKLTSADYLQKLASAVAQGTREYLRGLSAAR
ncbi:MAG: N-acetylmuramoyl-L-alanine amidase [Pseudomonadota bacterium]